MEKPKNKLFQDLTGKTFGRLTVIEYAGAKYPHSKITGKTFGRLTVIEYAGEKYPNGKKQKGHQWLCECSCKEKTIVLGGSLKSGKTTSCGCYQKEIMRNRAIDLTGKTFGKLTVIERYSMQGAEITWKCKCECGNESIVCGNNLRGGQVRSCGCRQGRFTHGLWGKPGYKKWLLSDPVRKMRHTVGGAVKKSLKKRKGSKNGYSVFDYLPYTPEDLKNHLESLWEPWMNWDNYGGAANDSRRTWWVDHIIPHTYFPYAAMDDLLFLECWKLENLRPLEKIANIKKNNRLLTK